MLQTMVSYNHLVYYNFRNSTALYQIDHVYPSSSSVANIVVYGEIGTPVFNDIHKFLKKKADKNELSFAVRHFVQVGFFK